MSVQVTTRAEAFKANLQIRNLQSFSSQCRQWLPLTSALGKKRKI
jgi:hypothetical protein